MKYENTEIALNQGLEVVNHATVFGYYAAISYGTFIMMLDMVRDIGTFWKTNKAHIWLPNIKQGFFGIVQPTAEEMAEFELTH